MCETWEGFRKRAYGQTDPPQKPAQIYMKSSTYKYPSCDSFVSEGVGEGEMTLGSAGTADERRDMMKGGSDGLRIAPVI